MTTISLIALSTSDLEQAEAVTKDGRKRTDVLWLHRHGGHAPLAMRAKRVQEETHGQ